jgi:uridine kinase
LALPRKVILVDGILIFSIPSLLELFDMRIFVDTADDIRLVRRLRRDMNERNRTLESVVSQYFRTVQPMHKMLVEPSKIHSHIIVPSADGIKDEAVDMVVSRLKDLIKE